MKLFLLFIIVLYLTPYELSAQKENNIWMFAMQNGLDFNTPVPSVISSKIPWTGEYADASVCDANGNLLFYTNTDTIWDKNGDPMPFCATGAWSGSPLYPGATSGTDGCYDAAQGAMILPVINNPDQYYVFVMSGSSSYLGGYTPAGYTLNYTIVDMSLNKGLGDVVPGKSRIVLDSVFGCEMVAVPGNNCDLWLMTHVKGDIVFKAYHVTAAGVDNSPVISKAGTYTYPNSYSNGEMFVSPNRKKISVVNVNVALSYPMGTEVYDFDPGTGIVSNPIALDTNSLDESAVFSPDNSKLYISEYDLKYSSGALVQYDLTGTSPAAIIASQVVIVDTFQDCIACGAVNEMRAGPDGKIYCVANASGIGISTYIACINYPNLKGAACDYINNAIYVPPYAPFPFFTLGLQQDLGAGFVKPLISPADSIYSRIDKSICTPGIDSIALNVPSGYYYYLWSNGSADTTLNVKKEDVYIALYSNYCTAHIDTFAVRNVNVSFTLGDDTSFCSPPFPYVLQVSMPGANYLWQDGSTDSFYTVNQTGNYSVVVKDAGCVDSSHVHVAFLDAPQHLGNDTTICYGQPIMLNLRANVPVGAYATWSDGTIGPAISVQDTGAYWVKVTDGPCLFTDSININTQLCECSFNMPSAFSPNNDGKNDFFMPVIQPGCPVSNYQLMVYDRWGEMVWMSHNPSEGWDGKYYGTPAQLGDYMYVIQFNGGTTGKKYFQKGDVTLVR